MANKGWAIRIGERLAVSTLKLETSSGGKVNRLSQAAQRNLSEHTSTTNKQDSQLRPEEFLWHPFRRQLMNMAKHTFGRLATASRLSSAKRNLAIDGSNEWVNTLPCLLTLPEHIFESYL
jgi:hypothetical protein